MLLPKQNTGTMRLESRGHLSLVIHVMMGTHLLLRKIDSCSAETTGGLRPLDLNAKKVTFN